MRGEAPFLVAGVGILADWVTTQSGLARGFIESHVSYSPFWALVIFWGALAALHVAGIRTRYKLLIGSWSLLGAINNILVLLGVFGGLVI